MFTRKNHINHTVKSIKTTKTTTKVTNFTGGSHYDFTTDDKSRALPTLHTRNVSFTHLIYSRKVRNQHHDNRHSSYNYLLFLSTIYSIGNSSVYILFQYMTSQLFLQRWSPNVLGLGHKENPRHRVISD